MHWQIDKKVNISNLVAALMVAMSVFWWAAHIERRVAILEIETGAMVKMLVDTKEHQTSYDARQDAEMLRLQQNVREEINALHAKLNQLKNQ